MFGCLRRRRFSKGKLKWAMKFKKKKFSSFGCDYLFVLLFLVFFRLSWSTGKKKTLKLKQKVKLDPHYKHFKQIF